MSKEQLYVLMVRLKFSLGPRKFVIGFAELEITGRVGRIGDASAGELKL